MKFLVQELEQQQVHRRLVDQGGDVAVQKPDVVQPQLARGVEFVTALLVPGAVGRQAPPTTPRRARTDSLLTDTGRLLTGPRQREARSLL